MTADDFVQQGGVEDGTGAGAYLVERRGHGDDAVAGDRAVGGLDANGAGDGCGLTDGATGIGAQGQGGLEGSYCYSGAAAGATGNAVQGPGVAGDTER